MWVTRFLIIMIYLGILLFWPTDKMTRPVQATSNTFDCAAVSEIPELECNALIDIYNNTGGPSWRERKGWLATTTLCNWHGVTCYDGSVAELDLKLNGLAGTLPVTIKDFTNLTRLNLSYNQLVSIPAEIGTLSNLEWLALRANQLQNIPSEVGNLSKLWMLDLVSNQLNNIPTEIGQLPMLMWLDLSANQLSSLPAEIGNLSSLKTLDFSSNKLDSIPVEICQLSAIETLNLAYNRITVTDPDLLACLNTKDSEWQATQTVPPTNLKAMIHSPNSIRLTWTPIDFQEKGGFYEISIVAGDSVERYEKTSDKSNRSYIVTDLTPGITYSFRIRTYTPAHDGEDPESSLDNQRNELRSEYSAPASDKIPAPTATATPTETPSSTPTKTATSTKTPTATHTSTPTATSSPTSTKKPTSTNTSTPTHTQSPTLTATSSPTAMPTATPTLLPTSPARADRYEADDICQQAKSLANDGSNQSHSFHQEDDEDWVTFELQGNVQYTLLAKSTSPDAHPQFDIYLICDDLPEFPTSIGFGNDAELIFTAPSSGSYYTRIKNRDGNIFGEDVTYELSLTTQQPIGGDLAIIITGHDDELRLQQNIIVSANRAYRTFLAGGIPKSRIRYLGLMDNAGGDERGDADFDGRSDIDTEATVENIERVITEWAVTQANSGSRIFIYLIDHGLFDYMLVNGNRDQLWADDLDSWLTTLEETTGAPIAVIYEACRSGSFITGTRSLSKSNRIIVTSTDDVTNAFPMLNGGAHFSDAFFSAVRRGENFYTAFQEGRTASLATELQQHPMLDDNGDHKYNRDDGDLARAWSLGGLSALAERPTFGTPQAPQNIVGSEGRIEVSISDASGVNEVWAEVYRPNFVEPPPAPDGIMPELDLDQVTFSDNDGDGVYVGLYDNFTLEGSYRFVIYGGIDQNDMLAPTVLKVDYEEEPVGPRGPTYTVYLPVITR